MYKVDIIASVGDVKKPVVQQVMLLIENYTVRKGWEEGLEPEP